MRVIISLKLVSYNKIVKKLIFGRNKKILILNLISHLLKIKITILYFPNSQARCKFKAIYFKGKAIVSSTHLAQKHFSKTKFLIKVNTKLEK